MSKDKRKDCEACKKLRSPKSFPKGTNIRLLDLEDCRKCEVTLNSPLLSNEIILELYGDIPCFDSWAGTKVFTITDLMNLFKLYDIPEVLHEEYYNKIVFFHQEYLTGRSKATEKENQRLEAAKKLEQDRKKTNPVKGKR